MTLHQALRLIAAADRARSESRLSAAAELELYLATEPLRREVRAMTAGLSVEVTSPDRVDTLPAPKPTRAA